MQNVKAASSLTLGSVRHGDGGKGRTLLRTNVKRKAARSIHYDPVDDRLQMHNVGYQPARDCAFEDALDVRVRDRGNLGTRVSWSLVTPIWLHVRVILFRVLFVILVR